MTIRQRSKEGICSAEFRVDGEFYQFTFNGKKGMPLITSKKQAREKVLAIKKEHLNLSDQARYYKVEKADVLIPPRAVLIAKGKDGKPRVLPLNAVARNVFKILVEDTTTGEWLFTNRDGNPMNSIKKGFTAACVRAVIEDLCPYDLRHTFATRLLDRGVHQYVISARWGTQCRSQGLVTPHALHPVTRPPRGKRW